MDRKNAIVAVGHVLAEHRVAAWAVDRCRQQAEADPSIPKIELVKKSYCGLASAAPAHLSGSL
jgi:hypothetical protein